MSDYRAYVFKTNGQILGYFLNPELEQLSEDQFLITGALYGPGEQLFDRAEFNPQILPYQVDVSSIPGPGSNISRIFHTYVQRARQPIEMVGFARQGVSI